LRPLRAVYVDSDPMVLAHARAQLTSTSDGALAVVDADVTDPRRILIGAAETLNLSRPVAVQLMATLCFVIADAVATQILLSLVAAVPAGSYVALFHQASDLGPAMAVTARRRNAMPRRRITVRSRGQLTELLTGLDVVSPGLVSVADWWPDPEDPRYEHSIPVYGVVARKP
jgi:hypothetical protein